MFNGSKGAIVHGDAHNTVGRDQNVNAYEVHGSMTNVYNNGGISENLDDPKTLSMLAQKAAANACYDSEQRFPPPNCHPGTRTQILKKLGEWIEDDSKATKVFWLHGTAGIGKSAIAQNLAEAYMGRKVAATFFFSRNDSTRDKLEPFVASLVYQFCKPNSPLRPALGPIIMEIIRADPNIFRTSFESQFEKLIVEPWSKIRITELDSLPNTIIVDGLDECIKHPSQERLLGIIHRFTAARRIPGSSMSWTFLICSRPEPQIRDIFDDFGTILGNFDVNSSDEAYWDIHKYFTDQFAILRKKHRRALHHEGTSWPSDDAFDKLISRADRQFIFATTVIKFLDTRDERPQDRLETVLRIYVDHGIDSPYSDLDLLYHQILSTCKSWEKVRPVLRLLINSHHPADSDGDTYRGDISWRSSEMIALLLHLKQGEVETILSRLHSVLRIPEDVHHDIHTAHASFTEFLSDPNRSRQHHAPHMSKSEYYDCVATLLLHTLSTLKPHYPLYHPQSDFTTTFSLRWDVYCREIESPSLDLLAALSGFDPYPFVAACMFYGFNLYFLLWGRVIKWAKSFGESTQHFVEIWESFLQGFCIAFPSTVSQHKAIWWTFKWERELFDGYDLAESQKVLLQKLYSAREATLAWKGHALLIPLGNNHGMLPEGWVVTCVKRTNGEVFRRVSGALMDNHGQLFKDIQNDTCKTVLGNWIKEDDLIQIKCLMKQRRKVFFPESLSDSDSSFAKSAAYRKPLPNLSQSLPSPPQSLPDASQSPPESPPYLPPGTSGQAVDQSDTIVVNAALSVRQSTASASLGV
uniref:Nephrocystin 3-like N-terminal domain-containing protein n=1 Tax=Moniliophthora roreri TaxID=221103 RepID=A0A0W0G2N2_MONRR